MLPSLLFISIRRCQAIPSCIPFRCSWNTHTFLAYVVGAVMHSSSTYPVQTCIPPLRIRYTVMHSSSTYPMQACIPLLRIRYTVMHSSSTYPVQACIPLLRIRYTVMHSSPPYPAHCHAFLSSVSGTLSCIPLSVSESLTA